MGNPLRLFRSGLSIWDALRLTWSLWLDQVRLLPRVTPRLLTFSSHRISSPRNLSGRDSIIYLFVKSTAALFPILIAILLSRSHFSSSDKWVSRYLTRSAGCLDGATRAVSSAYWPVLCRGKALECRSHTNWRVQFALLQPAWGDRKRWPPGRLPQRCGSVGKRWLFSPGTTGTQGWSGWNSRNRKLLQHQERLRQWAASSQHFYWPFQLIGPAARSCWTRVGTRTDRPWEASRVDLCHDPGKQDLFEEVSYCVQ
jgi:hypothetical protein